jgi:hypothetical protein
MNKTITAIDTIALRVPLDIWAPAPMAQGPPRTHVESLYVRVMTSGGVVGWGIPGCRNIAATKHSIGRAFAWRRPKASTPKHL